MRFSWLFLATVFFHFTMEFLSPVWGMYRTNLPADLIVVDDHTRQLLNKNPHPPMNNQVDMSFFDEGSSLNNQNPSFSHLDKQQEDPDGELQKAIFALKTLFGSPQVQALNPDELWQYCVNREKMDANQEKAYKTFVLAYNKCQEKRREINKALQSEWVFSSHERSSSFNIIEPQSSEERTPLLQTSIPPLREGIIKSEEILSHRNNFSLDDLDDFFISCILKFLSKFLSVKDLAKVSCISKRFKRLAEADELWEKEALFLQGSKEISEFAKQQFPSGVKRGNYRRFVQMVHTSFREIKTIPHYYHKELSPFPSELAFLPQEILKDLFSNPDDNLTNISSTSLRDEIEEEIIRSKKRPRPNPSSLMNWINESLSPFDINTLNEKAMEIESLTITPFHHIYNPSLQDEDFLNLGFNLGRMYNLKYLDVRHHLMDDNQARALLDGILERIKNNQAVEPLILNLSHNNITDRSLSELTELIMCHPALEEVDLSYNRIGSRNSTHTTRLLEAAIHHSKSLKKLDLTGNCLKENDCLILRNCSTPFKRIIIELPRQEPLSFLQPSLNSQILQSPTLFLNDLGVKLLPEDNNNLLATHKPSDNPPLTLKELEKSKVSRKPYNSEEKAKLKHIIQQLLEVRKGENYAYKTLRKIVDALKVNMPQGMEDRNPDRKTVLETLILKDEELKRIWEKRETEIAEKKQSSKTSTSKAPKSKACDEGKD